MQPFADGFAGAGEFTGSGLEAASGGEEEEQEPDQDETEGDKGRNATDIAAASGAINDTIEAQLDEATLDALMAFLNEITPSIVK